MGEHSWIDASYAGTSRRRFLAASLAWIAVAGSAAAAPGSEDNAPPSALVDGHPPWLTLPPTPDLPPPDKREMLAINGTQIFCAQFGQGRPVILLHGGMGNANYWGHQIRHLADRYRVIALDTRGHGRSPVTSENFGYSLFAQDVVALMDALDVPKASVVGWSDGAITGLELSMKHADRVDRLFAFGGNVSRRAMRRCAGACPTFVGYVLRCRTEYELLSPQPDKWPDLMRGLRAMWRGQGDFSKGDLERVQAATMIADGAHDEIIKPSHCFDVARTIRSARALLLPNVSHFAMLQDPAGFNAALDGFLA